MQNDWHQKQILPGFAYIYEIIVCFLLYWETKD